MAAALVAVAAGLDLFDGAIARRCGTDDEFGCNLDSLADLVSFGVAPAVALYLSLLHAFPVFGVVACVFYVVCGALRLARFPLVKDEQNFVGLPIPPAGLLLAGVAAGVPEPIPALILAFLLGVLMIGELPYPRRPWNLLRRPGKGASRKHRPATTASGREGVEDPG